MRLSYSSISTYKECPKRWEFKYVQKLKEKPRHYFSFGKAIHAALEFMYAGDSCPELDNVLEAFRGAWSDEGYKDQAQITKAQRDGEDMLRAYYAKHAPSWVRPLVVEAAFDFTFNHVRMVGFIDKIDILPDGSLHVIDYKTGKELDVSRIVDDEQLTTYEWAVRHLYPESRVGKLSLYHVPSLTLHSAESRTEKQINIVALGAISTANSIASGQFPPKPSERACYGCDFKALCPAWLP